MAAVEIFMKIRPVNIFFTIKCNPKMHNILLKYTQYLINDFIHYNNLRNSL